MLPSAAYNNQNIKRNFENKLLVSLGAIFWSILLITYCYFIEDLALVQWEQFVVILEEHKASHGRCYGQLPVSLALNYHCSIQTRIRVQGRGVKQAQPHSGVEQGFDRLTDRGHVQLVLLDRVRDGVEVRLSARRAVF